MGIVSRWQTQRQPGGPQRNPSRAQAARLGEWGAIAVPCGPPYPPPPTGTNPHAHAQVSNAEEEVNKTGAHRCSSVQMHAGEVCVHVRAHTSPAPACPPSLTPRPRTNLTRAHICRPQGRRVTYCTLCILPALHSLPLTQMHAEYRIRICFGGGRVSPKARAHAQQNIFF